MCGYFRQKDVCQPLGSKTNLEISNTFAKFKNDLKLARPNTI